MFCIVFALRIVQLNNSFTEVPTEACVTNNINLGEFSNSFEDRQKHVRVTVSLETKLNYGMCFKLSEVAPITNKFNNPGSFDYQKYMRSKRIVYTAKGEYLSSQSTLLTNLKNFRQTILLKNCESITKICTYVNAIIFGSNEIEAYYKTTYGQIGIAPIFAISGMHITLIYELIIYWLSKFRIIINRANLIALILLIFYSVLAGSSVAINRALMMIFGKLFLGLKPYQCLLLALSISLVYNPFNLLNSGYLLSYGLTAAIIFAPKDQFANPSINAISFSGFCYLISLPLSYSFNYTFNLLAPIAMLIFVPLITIVIMPLSLIVTIFPFPPLVSFLDLLIAGQNSLAEIFNMFTIVGGSISKLMWIIYVIIIYQLFKGRLKFLSLLIVWFIIVAMDYTAVPVVTFLDVGQGDSAVIEIGNRTYLIDVGNQPTEVWKSLRYLGTNRVDGVFISHAHNDHYGAVSEISKYVDIDAVYELSGSQMISGSIGINELYQDQNFTIIPIRGTDINNQLLVIKFTSGNFSVLFPGDIEQESEKQLAKEYCTLIDSDILKVPHHGSKSSSSSEFRNCVSPSFAVISSGKDNQYNHPDIEVVRAYNQSSSVFNTQVDGQVSFKLGRRLKKTSK